MSGTLTVLVYHYVRNFETSPYPRLKGLTLRDFMGQLEYLARHYEFVTIADCLEALEGRKALADNSILLTFDDGYAEHYENVYPLLKRRSIQGAFFVPARSITENVVLDVNKIHLILATADDPRRLLERLLEKISEGRERFGLQEAEAYIGAIRDLPRYDTREVSIFKKLLQRELPSAARRKFLDELFMEYVTAEEQKLAKEFYLSEDQLKKMISGGMAVGHHGYSHDWFTAMPPLQREEEIDRGLELLDRVGAPGDRWIFSYPYGAHDDALIDLLRRRGCAMAFTTIPDLVAMDPARRWRLPRLDTNDFPRTVAGPLSDWTLRILNGKPRKEKNP
jgi:peptidoglycan/xylan/chitin deacetylase (PgdA/CDA1 family)